MIERKPAIKFAKSALFCIGLILSMGALQTGCSETGSSGSIPDTPFVDLFYYPYMVNGELREYNPETNQLMQEIAINADTITSDRNLMVALDTDESIERLDEDNNTFLDHDPLPDFYVYALGQKLMAYERETRYTHELFDFLNDRTPSLNRYICDLRSITITDELMYRDNRVVPKNARTVYVRANNQSDCAGATTDFYTITMRETGDDFTIRKVREIDDIDFDDEGAGSSAESFEVKTEDHVIFEGERSSVTGAQMYADVIFHRQQFYGDRIGYLGFDPLEERYHFYFLDPSSERWAVNELWSAEKATFIFNGSLYAPIIFDYEDFVVIIHGWELIKIPKSILFDGEAEEEIADFFNNPVFEFTEDPQSYDPNELKFSFDSSSNNILVQDGDKDKSLSLINASGVVNHIKDVNDIGLENVLGLLQSNTAILEKQYTNDMAITSVNVNGGQETTILPKTGPLEIRLRSANNLFVDFLDQNLSMNRIARRYTQSESTGWTTAENFENALWGFAFQKFDSSGFNVLAQGEATTVLTNEAGSVVSPKLYTYITSGQAFDPDTPFGQIPSPVARIQSIDVFSENYGIATITSPAGVTENYYFNPGDPQLNTPNAETVDARKMMQRIY